MTQLTDWFPADVKPVRKGVYQVRDSGGYAISLTVGFAYWDGNKFGFRAFMPRTDTGNIERAYDLRTLPTSWPALVPWRGLAEKPE